MTLKPVLFWFRRDLRLCDNPALQACLSNGQPVIPVYILEDQNNASRALGGASRWWLHRSLESLKASLEKCGSTLILKKGDPAAVLASLIEETNANGIYWNRRYDKEGIDTDKAVKSTFIETGIHVETFNGSLLREPWEVKTGGGTHYKVFTPFWKNLKAMGPAREKACAAVKKIPSPKSLPNGDQLEDWNLYPAKPDWANAFPKQWTPGEKGAHQCLDQFLAEPVNDYDTSRNIPNVKGTSKLSPHLAFGEISPLEIWHKTLLAIETGANEKECWKFLSEIAWREFSYHLLYFYPRLSEIPLRGAFAHYPWLDDKESLQAWQRGLTGYPMVDAGMRELWQTGWMHNRVRMIAASFLIKHLLVPWQKGEAWFWDTLVDADIASNSASWQWVAGCGADASPYFRIFNPFGQGEKFDADGDYIRRYIPELKKLPNKYIHQPWSAPAEILEKAGIELGRDYPKPIVDHKAARERALSGYQQVKEIAS